MAGVNSMLSTAVSRTVWNTSLPNTARKINPFLVSSGLTREEADLTGLFSDSFTRAAADASGGE